MRNIAAATSGAGAAAAGKRPNFSDPRFRGQRLRIQARLHAAIWPHPCSLANLLRVRAAAAKPPVRALRTSDLAVDAWRPSRGIEVESSLEQHLLRGLAHQEGQEFLAGGLVGARPSAGGGPESSSISAEHRFPIKWGIALFRLSPPFSIRGGGAQ